MFTLVSQLRVDLVLTFLQDLSMTARKEKRREARRRRRARRRARRRRAEKRSFRQFHLTRSVPVEREKSSDRLFYFMFYPFVCVQVRSYEYKWSDDRLSCQLIIFFRAAAAHLLNGVVNDVTGRARPPANTCHKTSWEEILKSSGRPLNFC